MDFVFARASMRAGAHVIVLQGGECTIGFSLSGTVAPQPGPIRYEDDYKEPYVPQSVLFFASASSSLHPGLYGSSLGVECEVSPGEPVPWGPPTFRGGGQIVLKASPDTPVGTTEVSLSCFARDRRINYFGGTDTPTRVTVLPRDFSIQVSPPAPMTVEQGTAHDVAVEVRPPGNWFHTARVHHTTEHLVPDTRNVDPAHPRAEFQLSIPSAAPSGDRVRYSFVTNLTLGVDEPFYTFFTAHEYLVIFDVTGPIGDRWRVLGGITGQLGKPVAEQGYVGSMRFQRFEQGWLVWSQQYGAVTVPAKLAAAWLPRSDILGAPLRDAEVEPETGALYVHCRNGLIYQPVRDGQPQVYHRLRLTLSTIEYSPYPVPWEGYAYSYTRTVREDKNQDGDTADPGEEREESTFVVGYGPRPGSYDMDLGIDITSPPGLKVASEKVAINLATVANGRQGSRPTFTSLSRGQALSTTVTVTDAFTLRVDAGRYASFQHEMSNSEVFSAINIARPINFEMSPKVLGPEREWADNMRLHGSYVLIPLPL
ncbi:LGFP repeat-containing protein [Streptomyces sp. NPDC057298]|uniref:LGFP repeat-containing protein n=1 Tax=Streptomyces sp. NPDC057298 TaxID=3346091 RepID=UPI00364422B7